MNFEVLTIPSPSLNELDFLNCLHKFIICIIVYFFTYYSNQIKVEQEKRLKAKCTTRIFWEVYAEEFYARNRPNTHFNIIGWTN